MDCARCGKDTKSIHDGLCAECWERRCGHRGAGWCTLPKGHPGQHADFREAWGDVAQVPVEVAEALARALEHDQKLEKFDCPHDSEHRCNCGDVERDLFERGRRLRDEAVSAYRALVPKP